MTVSRLPPAQARKHASEEGGMLGSRYITKIVGMRLSTVVIAVSARADAIPSANTHRQIRQDCADAIALYGTRVFRHPAAIVDAKAAFHRDGVNIRSLESKPVDATGEPLSRRCCPLVSEQSAAGPPQSAFTDQRCEWPDSSCSRWVSKPGRIRSMKARASGLRNLPLRITTP